MEISILTLHRAKDARAADSDGMLGRLVGVHLQARNHAGSWHHGSASSAGPQCRHPQCRHPQCQVPFRPRVAGLGNETFFPTTNRMAQPGVQVKDGEPMGEDSDDTDDSMNMKLPSAKTRKSTTPFSNAELAETIKSGMVVTRSSRTGRECANVSRY